ncbi:MAG: DNA circularization N-terminal domain-containing protein [Microcystis sp.]|jgi:prophage DNA circulation protein|uniref:DNA circularization N-terminal domain-containing protein n=1 Tax=Microcystis sp. LE19-84.1B TaxID=3016438 RepID=UPI001DDC55A4|nr:DNA circularization N-terminal domain-containing protein [Microcystis sp. LE19-84.1B]MBE5228168.1 DNA circularization N-terminal domain-containing protein [Microcystis aeruginosa PMC 728.11]MCZ8225582.1 DNA circularization N-terminal domain-containing protein [Microcystis sp. LE19-84.1B]
MAIEIAGIQLNRVHQIETIEQNNFVYHQIPGKQGNLVQNFGRDSVRLQIKGIFYGNKYLADLEKLRKIYKEQKPVEFIAEIIGQAYFSQVILERFAVVQSATDPEQFSYTLTLAEYVPPTPSQAFAQVAGVDANIKADAASFMTVAMLPDALQFGSIPAITNPIEPLKASLDPIKEATSTLDGNLSDLKSLFNL